MKEKATYGNQHTGKMRWGRAVVCAVAGCLAFGLSADVGAEARIPIVGWAGLSQDKASAARYAEAKDAGFTHLTQWCKTPSDAGRLLSEAEKAGVKLIIGFGGRNITRMADEAEAFTAVAKGSPALEYYFIADEPHIEKAEALRDCIARYAALDPAHPCYVNLYGAAWDPENRDDRGRMRRNTGCDTYGEYLGRLYDAVPLKMVSFDVYPVCAAKPLGNAEHRLHGARAILNDRWYETLETASAFARKRGLPMFAFALSTAHGRDGGRFWNRQWQTAFEVHPKIVTVTWWNEWCAQLYKVDGVGYIFTDNFDIEHSRDIEPMEGGHGDQYYKWLCEYIRAYRAGEPCPDLTEK